jgi:hypothetical protein
MRKETKYFVIVIFVAILGGIIFIFNGRAYLQHKRIQYRQQIINCLIANKIKLYVATGCTHCDNQKLIFGELIKKVNFFDCKKNGIWEKKCEDNKVFAVPTWSFPKSLKSNLEKNNIFSCSDCKKSSGGIDCKDICYYTKDASKVFISDFLNLEELNKVSGCNIKK